MRGRKFYLPHNMDFRGRAYVLPPHLTHLGSDLSRGLLLFDEKRPLGEGGLRWLKIHLANVFGQDKFVDGAGRIEWGGEGVCSTTVALTLCIPRCSFDDRVAFVDEHLDDVLDSARDPLGTTASVSRFGVSCSPPIVLPQTTTTTTTTRGRSAGGGGPRIPGRPWRPATRFRAPWAAATRPRSCPGFQCTRTAPATACSTMRPLAAILRVRGMSISRHRTRTARRMCTAVGREGGKGEKGLPDLHIKPRSLFFVPHCAIFGTASGG